MAAAWKEGMAEEGGPGLEGGCSSAPGSAQQQRPLLPPQRPQLACRASVAPVLAPGRLPQNSFLVALPIVAPQPECQASAAPALAPGRLPQNSFLVALPIVARQPECQASAAPVLAPDQLPQNSSLVALPIVALENILSFMSYDEISQLRMVCKRMDLVCQRMLNQGFLKVERYHNLLQKQVKAQLPRRESERRSYPLARHADILAAIETRLSLLNMTFMKYMDSNLCCFFPGKVIDEIYRVLRYVNSTRAPQRAHEVLKELRDISSMALEYFDEKIAPILKRKLTGSDASGRLGDFSPVAGPSANVMTTQLFSKQSPSVQELTKLQQQVRTNGAGVIVLSREISELRTKVQEQQKQLQDQDQKLLEQTQILGEQNARLAELEGKLQEVMERAAGNSSGSGHNEESPQKRKSALEVTDPFSKSKRARN